MSPRDTLAASLGSTVGALVDMNCGPGRTGSAPPGGGGTAPGGPPDGGSGGGARSLSTQLPPSRRSSRGRSRRAPSAGSSGGGGPRTILERPKPIAHGEPGHLQRARHRGEG
eukprot:5087068-Pyramimonas_sp.AAC.1